MLAASICNMRENTEWNVPIFSRRAVSSPTSVAMRERISFAALLVNVSASMFHGFMPCDMR